MSKKKKSRRNCKLDLSDGCFSRISAKCVDYEGTLSEYSELDPESNCLDVEEVIEDANNIIDDIKDAIDVSEQGCCVTYTPSNEEVGLVIKDVVSAHEGMICDLEDRVEKLEENCGGGGNCSGGVDECGNPVDCCDILKKYAFGVGINQLTNQNIWTNFSSNNYSDLYYKLDKKGVYKIILEVESQGDFGSSIKVGLSVNNSNPLNNPFNQLEIYSHNGFYQHTNCNFIYEGLKGDVLSFKTNGNGSSDSDIRMAKMIVEKIK